MKLDESDPEKIKEVYEGYLKFLEKYFNERKYKKYMWFYKGALIAIRRLRNQKS